MGMDQWKYHYPRSCMLISEFQFRFWYFKIRCTYIEVYKSSGDGEKICALEIQEIRERGNEGRTWLKRRKLRIRTRKFQFKNYASFIYLIYFWNTCENKIRLTKVIWFEKLEINNVNLLFYWSWYILPVWSWTFLNYLLIWKKRRMLSNEMIIPLLYL